MSYASKLKDPRWIELRDKAIKHYDGCNCFGCGCAESIHVHHDKYDYSKEPWEYTVDDLSLLCNVCHENYHKNNKLLKKILTNHRLFYSYEFSKLISIMDLFLCLDTSKYKEVIEFIESKQNTF